MLTVDTEGQVAQWDLVEVSFIIYAYTMVANKNAKRNGQCKKIKIFGNKAIEEVAQQLNSMETFSNWCSVDTKIGVSSQLYACKQAMSLL